MGANTTEIEQKLTPLEVRVVREFLSFVTVLCGLSSEVIVIIKFLKKDHQR